MGGGFLFRMQDNEGGLTQKVICILNQEFACGIESILDIFFVFSNLGGILLPGVDGYIQKKAAGYHRNVQPQTTLGEVCFTFSKCFTALRFRAPICAFPCLLHLSGNGGIKNDFLCFGVLQTDGRRRNADIAHGPATARTPHIATLRATHNPLPHFPFGRPAVTPSLQL